MTTQPLSKINSLLSINDLDKNTLLFFLEQAQAHKGSTRPNLLKEKTLASCFFEPSTRTRLSFESAMKRLGGNVIGFSDIATTSSVKGESLKDSMHVISEYADIIVLRHPLDGAARLAAESTQIPVVNAGDGSNQHPSQTLLDLFSIKECQGKLDGLSIAMVGDLKYGRTTHSLAQACAHFGMRMYFISPEQLDMPEHVCDDLRKKGIKFSFHRTIDQVIHKVDILYMCRLQKERLAPSNKEIHVEDEFILHTRLLDKAKSNMKVMHPLPRTVELPQEVDETPFAYYFQQAKNGLYVRQAILSILLGKIL